MKAPYPEHRAVYFHSPKRDNPEAETVYTENLEKAAQTAELLLQDLQDAHKRSDSVPAEMLLFGWIEQVARINNDLKRMVADKTQIK